MTEVQKQPGQIAKTFERVLRWRELGRKALAGGREMPDREKPLFSIDNAVLGVLGATWLVCSTVLISKGHGKEITLLSGVVLLLAGVQRFLTRQQKVETKAEQSRTEIKEQVEVAKGAAIDAAQKVNGVTESAMEKMRAQHIEDMQALKEQHEGAMEALKERARADRHKHDGALQVLKSELDMAIQANARLIEEKGQLEGQLMQNGTKGKLEENSEKLDDIRSLVNGNMGVQLRINVMLAKRVADLTKDPADVRAAEVAVQLYDEHMKKEAELDGVAENRAEAKEAREGGEGI